MSEVMIRVFMRLEYLVYNFQVGPLFILVVPFFLQGIFFGERRFFWRVPILNFPIKKALFSKNLWGERGI